MRIQLHTDIHTHTHVYLSIAAGVWRHRKQYTRHDGLTEQGVWYIDETHEMRYGILD